MHGLTDQGGNFSNLIEQIKQVGADNIPAIVLDNGAILTLIDTSDNTITLLDNNERVVTVSSDSSICVGTNFLGYEESNRFSTQIFGQISQHIASHQERQQRRQVFLQKGRRDLSASQTPFFLAGFPQTPIALGDQIQPQQRSPFSFPIQSFTPAPHIQQAPQAPQNNNLAAPDAIPAQHHEPIRGKTREVVRALRAGPGLQPIQAWQLSPVQTSPAMLAPAGFRGFRIQDDNFELDANVRDFSDYCIGQFKLGDSVHPNDRLGNKLIQAIGGVFTAEFVVIESTPEQLVECGGFKGRTGNEQGTIRIEGDGQFFKGNFTIDTRDIDRLEKTNKIYMSENVNPSWYMAQYDRARSQQGVFSLNDQGQPNFVDAPLFEASSQIVISQQIRRMCDLNGNLMSNPNEFTLISQAGIDWRVPTEQATYLNMDGSVNATKKSALEQRMLQNWILTIKASIDQGCNNFAFLIPGSGPFLTQAKLFSNEQYLLSDTVQQEIRESIMRTFLRAVAQFEAKGAPMESFYLACPPNEKRALVGVASEPEFGSIRTKIIPTVKDIVEIADFLTVRGKKVAINQAADTGTFFLGCVGNHFHHGSGIQTASEEFLANTTTMLTSNQGLTNLYKDLSRMYICDTRNFSTCSALQQHPHTPSFTQPVPAPFPHPHAAGLGGRGSFLAQQQPVHIHITPPPPAAPIIMSRGMAGQAPVGNNENIHVNASLAGQLVTTINGLNTLQDSTDAYGKHTLTKRFGIKIRKETSGHFSGGYYIEFPSHFCIPGIMVRPNPTNLNEYIVQDSTSGTNFEDEWCRDLITLVNEINSDPVKEEYIKTQYSSIKTLMDSISRNHGLINALLQPNTEQSIALPDTDYTFHIGLSKDRSSIYVQAINNTPPYESIQISKEQDVEKDAAEYRFNRGKKLMNPSNADDFYDMLKLAEETVGIAHPIPGEHNVKSVREIKDVGRILLPSFRSLPGNYNILTTDKRYAVGINRFNKIYIDEYCRHRRDTKKSIILTKEGKLCKIQGFSSNLEALEFLKMVLRDRQIQQNLPTFGINIQELNSKLNSAGVALQAPRALVRGASTAAFNNPTPGQSRLDNR